MTTIERPHLDLVTGGFTAPDRDNFSWGKMVAEIAGLSRKAGQLNGWKYVQSGRAWGGRAHPNVPLL